MAITITCADCSAQMMNPTQVSSFELSLQARGLPIDAAEVAWHCGCEDAIGHQFVEFPNDPSPGTPDGVMPPPFTLPPARAPEEEEE